ncbi:MAG: spondin domain-containing protein [Acidobacteria bacterium]|nr:spondin domain-containing protein [Acidobacteriota bacterium]
MSQLRIRVLVSAVLTAFVLLVLPTAGVRAAWEDDDDAHFVVTVTNITQGQVFTPIVAASHKNSIKLFRLGQPASEPLEVLAEAGDTGPLTTALASSPAVLDIADSGAPLPPGESVTLSIATHGTFRFVSVAAMLVPTNDAFFAVNGVEGPRGRDVVTHYSPAYDAGTEANDELCTHIPGPPTACQGEGFNPARGVDNFVHIHPGIHGIGNLSAARYDWRNPVARITIRRTE